MSDKPRIVIIGAGIGGLWAMLSLARKPVDVLLVDRNNYHTFQALLYQVAASELGAEQIAYPVRGILGRFKNVRFAMAEVQDIDFDTRQIRTSGPSLSYDYLALAPGSVTNYFGVPGAAEYGFPLKTLEHGIDLRNHVLRRFERAIYTEDVETRRRLLTFVIVGGGATGVEFAGAMIELVRGPLSKDFRSLDHPSIRVLLVETRDRVLPGMPEELQNYTVDRLRQIGVDVRLQQAVTRVEPTAVYLDGGEAIPTETVVWAAGVRGSPQAEAWGLEVTPAGRVAVRPTLQVPNHDEVYVVGDLAHVEQDGQVLAMVAPVGIQEAQSAARNILLQIDGQAPQVFRYKNPGVMATIGRNAAVAQIGRRQFTGFVGWVLWLAVHLVRLIGFRNRLMVLINWAWDYFLLDRAVRLIVPCTPVERR
jgi:NADH dehydrogenase